MSRSDTRWQESDRWPEAANTSSCPNCGHDTPADASFCASCGVPLANANETSQTPDQSDETARETEGERRHVTVLFCDLVDSTEITTRLDAEHWHAISSQYQRTVADAISKIGGHVAKFLGDGVIAYFGYPTAQEDAAERAVRAGLAIVGAMPALNGLFASEHKVRLSARVGIHTGSVVVAPGGGDETDIFGDAPNIASRIQALCAPDTVLMTAAVHELVSGLFAVEDKGPQPLKGVDQPVRLYRAVSGGLASARNRAARKQAQFVGREDELRLLLDRWQKVRAGEGQLMLVSGEAGIGKTRLLEEFKTRIKADPHLWIECAGAACFANTPFRAVIQMLDQGLGWRGELSPQERAARLERALEPTGMALGEAVPLIAEMLALPVPEKYPPLSMTPELKRKRLLGVLVEWVFSAARNQPLVIAIEDLHWVDPSTLELLQALVEQVGTRPIMLFCTARSEFVPPWPARPHHMELTLGRLTNRETRDMVTGLIAPAALPQDVVDAVIHRTDGVPLFATELTRLMLAHDRALGTHDIPETLQDSLAARLDRLGRAKEIAQFGAVLGREFTYEMLRAISPVSEHELQTGLSKLVTAEVIDVRGKLPSATYHFRHALIQDAAYEALLKSRRRHLHALVAQTMETRFSDIAASQPEVLAQHYSEARRPDDAIKWWRNASQKSVHATAYAEALEQLNRGLEQLAKLPESPERDALEVQMRIELTTPLVGTKGYTSDAIRANVERAVELSQRIKEEALFPSLGGQLSLAYSSSHMIRAVAVGEQLFAAAESVGDRGLRVLASWLYGMALTGRGRLGDALKVLEHGLALSDPKEDAELADRYSSDARIASIAYKSLVLQQLGFSDRALAEDKTSVAEAMQGGHSATIGVALTLRVCLHLVRNDHVALADAAGELAALAKRQASQPLQAVSGALLLLLRADRDGDDAAFAEAHTTIEAIKAIGWHLIVGWLGVFEAKVCLRHDRIEAARKRIDTLQEVIEPRGHDFFLPELYRLRAELAARENAGDSAAETHLRHAIAVARGQTARFAELRCATDLAVFLCDRGRREEAYDLLAPLHAWFKEGADTVDLKRTTEILGRLRPN